MKPAVKAFIRDTPAAFKLEFWAMTTIYVFAMFFHITDIIDAGEFKLEKGRAIPFEYYFYPVMIRFTILYIAILIMNFVVVPGLVKKESVPTNIMLLIGTAVGLFLSYGITDTYIQHYLFAQYPTKDQAYNVMFMNAFEFTCVFFLAFIIYTVIKYASLYALANIDSIQAKYKFINKEVILIITLWLIAMLFQVLDGDALAILELVVLVFVGILLYIFSTNYLIPRALKKRFPFLFYIVMNILLLLVLYFPLSFLMLLIIQKEDPAFGMTFFNSLVHMFITVPLVWFVYKRKMKRYDEVLGLKKELKYSNANLNFLRSQINPHFLFNALNTIYGTAIQEKAERTSEGIEKLGDMMRFMLQENMQEKISLTREIDYLNNYISLQKLRTDMSPTIRIETAIDDSPNTMQIAPMLLIPFVENAFKHGISFREPSDIKVSLEILNNTLNFDVHNSKHPRPDNDPEKNKSGIGLNNVKQRLKLLYPGRHELIIRDTAKDFFVHLTIRLIK